MPTYLRVLSQGFDFAGRSPRRDYWWFTLVHVIVAGLFGAIDALTGTLHAGVGLGLLSGVYVMLTLVPSLALVARRLQDAGLSAWWTPTTFLPLVGVLAFVAIGLLRSRRAEPCDTAAPKAAA